MIGFSLKSNSPKKKETQGRHFHISIRNHTTWGVYFLTLNFFLLGCGQGSNQLTTTGNHASSSQQFELESTEPGTQFSEINTKTFSGTLFVGQQVINDSLGSSENETATTIKLDLIQDTESQF